MTRAVFCSSFLIRERLVFFVPYVHKVSNPVINIKKWPNLAQVVGHTGIKSNINLGIIQVISTGNSLMDLYQFIQRINLPAGYFFQIFILAPFDFREGTKLYGNQLPFKRGKKWKDQQVYESNMEKIKSIRRETPEGRRRLKLPNVVIEDRFDLLRHIKYG